ncbi:hypothetical protein BOX15_Mlig003230g5, partial [Macrostomum lignano]
TVESAMSSNDSNLSMLLDMGFSEIRAKKALLKSGNKGIEAAMDWLSSHQDDPDIDDPIPEPEPAPAANAAAASSAASGESAGGTAGSAEATDADAKSLKCDDCGKLFRSPAEAEFHAAKTGHANFSQSTEEVRALTAEEKAEQLRQLEAKLEAKRQEREAEERRAELERERKRRTDGKGLKKWREESAEQELKREAEARRREKEEQREYLARIRQRYAQDRAEMEAREAEERRAAAGQPAAPAAAAGAPSGPSLPKAATPAAVSDGDTCRLQIRLPGGGQPLTTQFGAKESLAAVACYVRTNRTDGRAGEDFALMTLFPKRVFTAEDMEKPLYTLDLCPSAALMVTKPV